MIRKAINIDTKFINDLGVLVNKNFINLFKIEEILKESFSKIYVYEENNKVLGFLHITDLGENVDIINLVVHPEFRNKKIASALLDYMLSEAENKTKVWTLEVSTKNKIAINLYKKFGFEVVNIRNAYYEDADAYLMARKRDR